jgi:hypothetical protein
MYTDMRTPSFHAREGVQLPDTTHPRTGGLRYGGDVGTGHMQIMVTDLPAGWPRCTRDTNPFTIHLSRPRTLAALLGRAPDGRRGRLHRMDQRPGPASPQLERAALRQVPRRLRWTAELRLYRQPARWPTRRIVCAAAYQGSAQPARAEPHCAGQRSFNVSPWLCRRRPETITSKDD